jgi:CBS-domain-containing membrane protein
MTRRARVRPAADLADRLPVCQAIPLVLVETLGLGIIFGIYALLDARDSVLAPLLVPFAVSFVLIVANSGTPGARPLRVVGSYVIAAMVGLGVSALPGPTFPEPVLANFTPASAARALPLVLLLATGVVTLAWAAHKVLGDADYPARWW